ncbi:hypothetical protein H4582DRAFT_2020478 [Lactarius indigo]|nr:hypothetical protein H4582DRAFT_2020478 [Lactarius indigo]
MSRSGPSGSEVFRRFQGHLILLLSGVRAVRQKNQPHTRKDYTNVIGVTSTTKSMIFSGSSWLKPKARNIIVIKDQLIFERTEAVFQCVVLSK